MERGRQSRVTGRQTEVPLRVQDPNRQSMMYTTPQRSQLSMGQLNVLKPTSVTSERRTSFFGRRTSTMGGFGGVEKIKDTRPLHDKSYVQQCIRQLHEFLTEHGYTGTLSAKTLQSPSTKEFVKMFEFIYCQLDPTFKMPNLKIEEEIPAILRTIGYPFVLSKSSMYSVGAPHTWPMALGALMWLIDNVKILQTSVDQKTLFFESSGDPHDIDEEIEYHKLFGDYTADSYIKFMHNNDTFEEEDEAFTAKLRKLYNVDEAMLSMIKEKYRIVSDELEQLEKESQSDRLMSKRMEKAKLQKDLKQLQTYGSSLDSFKSNLQGKVSELENEQQNTISQAEILKHDHEKLQLHLQNQKFTPADVERINREKRKLQQTISSLTKTLEEAEQHKWNNEIALAKAKEREEGKLFEYHKLARKLQLIPVSAKNARGHDFEIRQFNCGSSSIVQHNTETQMRLRKLITDIDEESSQLAYMKLSLEESNEQVNSNILDKSNDVKLLREQICKLDEQLDSRMQELDQEEHGWADEIESVENNRKQLEKKVNHGYDEAMQQLKAAQHQYHLVLQETADERVVVTKNLTSIFTTATNCLAATERSMEDLHSRVKQICSKAVEDDEVVKQKMQDACQSFVFKANSSLN